ncbi:hypothetical protein FRC08_017452 [Ceratobasidium sp. 394]|nr:hypothetical protein FRC08_017452 [Ceratobasidium sp. 394]
MSASTDPTTLYSEWCSTRTAFSLALSAFNRASRADRRLCTLHESILLSVEQELLGLYSEGDQFFRAVAHLKKLRNHSVTLVPINYLPAEILAPIFIIAVHDSKVLRPKPNASKRIDFTTVLASVSHYWRQIALSTPELWSYIDLAPRGNQLEYQTLWLERSRNQPLHIRYCTLSGPVSGSVDRMKALIQPHLHRCGSWCLAVETRFGQEILRTAIIPHAPPPTLQSLTLFASHYQSFLDTNVPPQHDFEKFLQSVRILRLHSTALGTWVPTAFRNLLELTLDAMSFSEAPTAYELVEILRVCTGLRTLRLSSLPIMPPPFDPNPKKIYLEELETLSLRRLPRGFRPWLLSLLVP